jgi:hypothetical protein
MDFDIRPLHPVFAAEVLGVDLREPCGARARPRSSILDRPSPS